MEPEIKNVVFIWIARVLFFGILIVGAFFIWPEFQRDRSLKRQEAALDEKLERKRAEIRKLQENQRRFKSDRDFVELIARQNRRVFPGELVFVYEEK